MSDSQQNQPAHRSQLHMKRGLDALPELVIPSGYSLRHFTADDGPAWAALLEANGDIESWDAARAEPYFAADSHMPLEGAFFITSGHEPVATAQLHLKTDGPYAPTPEMGWVAVVPQHQGHGLAAVVCLAVMHYAAAAGSEQIFLLTDDRRLPAIWTYLKLGFTPWLTDATHAGRWDAVHAALAQHRRNETAQPAAPAPATREGSD
jgi:GNAT superfamily N-acetyltransferase